MPNEELLAYFIQKLTLITRIIKFLRREKYLVKTLCISLMILGKGKKTSSYHHPDIIQYKFAATLFEDGQLNYGNNQYNPKVLNKRLKNRLRGVRTIYDKLKEKKKKNGKKKN